MDEPTATYKIVESIPTALSPNPAKADKTTATTSDNITTWYSLNFFNITQPPDRHLYNKDKSQTRLQLLPQLLYPPHHV